MSEKYLGENSTPLLINQIKENCTQKRSTLPIASVDELGNTYQYIGTTSGSLVHGYFYECVSDGQNPATYSWQNINIQETPTASDITFDNTTSGLTADDVQEAIDEVDSDIDNVKQALSNEVSARATLGGHNLLPLTLDNLKKVNTSGVWSGNTYSKSGIDFAVQTNTDGYITGISVSGTATGLVALSLGEIELPNGSYKVNGTPLGASINGYSTLYQIYNGSSYSDLYCLSSASGYDLTVTNRKIKAFICRVENGTIITTPVIYYPMIRLASDIDDTYQPYSKTNVELTQGLSEVQDLVLDQGGITTKSYAPVIAVNDALPVNAVDVSAKIEPIQAGSGTPSPSNVRAISGRDSVTATRAGKNLVEETYVNANIAGDGTLRVDSLQDFNVCIARVKKGCIYVMSINSVETLPVYAFFTSKPVNGSISYDGNRIVGGNTYFIAPIDGYIAFRDTLNETKTQLEVGSVATAYEAPNVNDYTIQLGDTYYGGTLDVTTGVLTVDRAYAEFDGSVDEQWQSSSTQQSGKYAFTIMLSDVKLPSTTSTEIPLTCNEYVSRTSGDVWKNNDGVGIYMDGRLWVYESSVSDNSSVNSWLAFLANNPIQLVYPLATPITIQLTPQEIQMLQGNNTIFTDSGDTSIQYYANGVKNLETVVAEMQTEADGAVNNQFQNGAVNLFENKASSVAHSSVTAIVNNDKTITVNGAPSSNFVLQLGTIILDSTKKYKLSGCPKNQPTNTQLRFTDNSGNNYIDYGNGVEFTGASSGTVYLICYSATGNTFKNAVFKPMITYADVPNSDYAHYVPYCKSNRELTDVVEQTVGGHILTGIGTVSVTADGVKTYKALLYELSQALGSYLDGTDVYVKVTAYDKQSNYHPAINYPVVRLYHKSSDLTGLEFSLTSLGENVWMIRYIKISFVQDNCIYRSCDNGTITDLTETVPSSGTVLRLYFDVYKMIS